MKINLNAVNLRPWKIMMSEDALNDDAADYRAERLRDEQDSKNFDDDLDAYLQSIGLTFDQASPEDISEYRYIDLSDAAVVAQIFDGYVAAMRSGRLTSAAALELIQRLELDQKAASGREMHDALSVGIRENDADATADFVEYVPHEDEPLTLVEAVCLPILGGKLFESGKGIPSSKIKVKTLRAEIAAGRLKRVPPFNNTHYVSTKTIKEWTAWRVEDSLLISSGSSQNTHRKASYERKATGPSPMDRSELARDSALSFVNKLRRPD